MLWLRAEIDNMMPCMGKHIQNTEAAQTNDKASKILVQGVTVLNKVLDIYSKLRLIFPLIQWVERLVRQVHSSPLRTTQPSSENQSLNPKRKLTGACSQNDSKGTLLPYSYLLNSLPVMQRPVGKMSRSILKKEWEGWTGKATSKSLERCSTKQPRKKALCQALLVARAASPESWGC